MGLASEIRDPEKAFSGYPDPGPGIKKAPDPGSGSATLISCCLLVLGALTFESIVPVSAHFHSFNKELNAVIVEDSKTRKKEQEEVEASVLWNR
jgi:hypothetical protein